MQLVLQLEMGPPGQSTVIKELLRKKALWPGGPAVRALPKQCTVLGVPKSAGVNLENL